MIVLRVLVGVVASLIFLMTNAIVVMYMERKVLGHLQSRLGPMRTGWHGVLQPIADAVKLLAKEDVCPAGADKLLFRIAPILAFVPAVLVYISMPWVQTLFGGELDTGLLYLFAVAGLFPVGVLVAGWSSYSKYPLLGAFRAAAQQISYEVPMLLSVIGVAMLAGSLKLSAIVDGQAQIWNVVLQPLAFVLWLIVIPAELNRTPFDLPEAESELVAGFTVEYSAMRFAIFFLAEYANLFTLSLLGAILYLGGWHGPLLPGFVWLLAKAYLLVFVALWARATLPRVRVDQFMAFGWKVLLPMALLNVAITTFGLATTPWVLPLLGVAGVALLVFVVGRVRASGFADRAPATEAPAPGGEAAG